jgi:cytochrome c oxidase subunit III
LSDAAQSDAALAASVREQFATERQQRHTQTFGMWIFLITEVMFFGALFVAFTVYRMYYHVAFAAGSADMEIVLGSINTAVLLTSSLTMALAVYNAEVGKERLLGWFLVATLVLGCVFLAIKFTEYYLHYLDHKMPGVSWSYPGPNAPKVEMFFVFYYFMTGIHAIHMVIGIGLLLVMLVRTLAGSFEGGYSTPVAVAGLYWSFVDVVWVFLFAIFYIQGLHK